MAYVRVYLAFMCATIEKSIGRCFDITSYVANAHSPYVFGRAVENGLPRDVNSFLAIWKQRTRDHARAPLIKVKREQERERVRGGGRGERQGATEKTAVICRP